VDNGRTAVYLADVATKEITTLLELRKRAEYLNVKMHGGSLMLCDVNTFLACLDRLAEELIGESNTVDAISQCSGGGSSSEYYGGVSDAYRRVAKRLLGLEAEL